MALLDETYARFGAELASIEAHGRIKSERAIVSPQGAKVIIDRDGEQQVLLNFCANNYLGLANDSRVIEAACQATRKWGAGLGSVRFICGTQAIHKELEREIASYLRFDDAILFATAFDANGGIFEPLLDEADAIVSDGLNHASIIDGIRLSKARRLRFETGDMADLERCLKIARMQGARTILIATDGVFSMDGTIANLDGITRLAAMYEALVLVDDCHASGILGHCGRGSAEFRGVEGRVDILTGTFGKALGGSMGGFVAAKREVIALLRQRARPYLFSNALAPPVCGASLAAIRIAASEEGNQLRLRLWNNARRFRSAMSSHGFELLPGEHPIVPVMLHDDNLAKEMSDRLLDEGVFATAFSFPVVPRGAARIRTQVSAAHTPEQIDMAVEAFARAGRKLGIIE